MASSTVIETRSPASTIGSVCFPGISVELSGQVQWLADTMTPRMSMPLVFTNDTTRPKTSGALPRYQAIVTRGRDRHHRNSCTPTSRSVARAIPSMTHSMPLSVSAVLS